MKECKLGYLLLCGDEMIFTLKLGECKLWSLNHFISGKKVTISVRISNDVSQCLTSVKDSFFLEPSLGSTPSHHVTRIMGTHCNTLLSYIKVLESRL